MCINSVIADLVIKNGKVATVDRDFSFCEAVAVKDGWIIDVGSDESLSVRIGPDTTVIDLEGKVLLPAANDAHIHATLTGCMLGPDFVDVGPSTGITSVNDLQNILMTAVQRAKPGQWIFGSGFIERLLKENADSGKRLSRWDLDPVSPDTPVILHDFGLHTMLVNSKALELAGIDRNFRELRPEEGILERDPGTGEPNGRFKEWPAHDLIARHCPVVSEQEIEECILRVQRALNGQGITSHTDIVGPGLENVFIGVARERAVHVYERMFREGKLSARVSLSINPCVDGIESFSSVTDALDRMDLPAFSDKNWVKADTVKLFGDRDVWLRPSENRTGSSGRSVFPGQTEEEQADEITRTIVELHRSGWQICIHAIGGRTIDVAVDAFAKAQETYPRKAPRHFIIHADDMTLENSAKMSKYHIGCSPQPIAANILAAVNAPLMSVGEELFNWQAYIDDGVVVAGGSDAPCFSFNWRKGVQFAVTRVTANGVSVRPDLAMKLEDAIRMYTIEGARQENMEGVRGSIETNKVADFQVLGRNIFDCPKSEIGEIPVIMTICAGKTVFDANNSK